MLLDILVYNNGWSEYWYANTLFAKSCAEPCEMCVVIQYSNQDVQIVDVLYLL